ncbi:MAG: preprotein translocase subunit SecG [Candidatus Marinimicrobia bacterium]|nr:preprotein translocase subunit SecG [Candidatus Neomarinimicrobiota bacterium]
MFIRALLLVIEGLVALMLIGIILLQKSKSEGLGVAFGGGMGETLFGSRAGNVLTKATIVLSVIFMANTLVLANLFVGQRVDQSLVEQSGLLDTAAPAPQAAPMGMQSPLAPGGVPGEMRPPDAPTAPLTGGDQPMTVTPLVAPPPPAAPEE